jgi:hypothetical protein
MIINIIRRRRRGGIMARLAGTGFGAAALGDGNSNIKLV